MKKRTRKNNRNSSRHNYGGLEPRLMLSADLDAARNLVVNGDFETEDSTAFIAFADGDDTDTQDLKVRELMTDFQNIVVVDSTAGQIDSIAQDIATIEGNDYVISFDLRGSNPNTALDADTNDVEVLFGGESQGIFRGTRRWQTITIAVQADSDLSRLEFREASTNSDGRGVLIDHIALASVRETNVRNNSFENLNEDIGGGAVNSDIPSVFTVPNNPTQPIGVTQVGDAADGDHVLDLNTSDLLLDRVFMNVRTEPGSSYFLTFDLRNSEAGEDSRVRVRWDGAFAGSFRSTDDWQQVGTLVTSTSDFTTLFFREDSQNGPSVQIDNIRLFRVGSLASDYVVDLNGNGDGLDNSLSYVENRTANISENATLAFANGAELVSATARILGFTGTEALSAVTAGTDIASTFNTTSGILRLVGRASVATYESLLQSLTFTDTNDDPEATTREVVVSVTDGTIGSDRSVIELDVMPVNDPPVVTNVDNQTVDQGETRTLNVLAIDPDGNNGDLTFNIQVDGQDFIFDGDGPTISETGEIEFTVVTHGDAVVNIEVMDTDGATSTTEFTVTSPFVPPTDDLPGDFDPFSGQRQLSNVDPAQRNGVYDVAPALTIDTTQNFQAIFETPEGEIVVELFAADSPITVNNFVNLAEDGFFDGLTFHRVIEDFVAQGGDPAGTGTGGPGYQFQDELNNGQVFDGPGQLAMANSGPNTNGSQFFFTLNESPAFAGQHTIFGQIIEGMDVLNQVNFTTGDADPEIIERVRIEIV